jgi:hypothetical protein
MDKQVTVIVIAYFAALIAVPFSYSHRINAVVFGGCVIAFAGIPLYFGLAQKHAHRGIAMVAAGLLLLCPVVYAITDPLAAEYERWRDIYFLGTFSAIVFVSASWLVNFYRSGRWLFSGAALLCLVLAAIGVIALLGLVMYLE